MAPELNYFTCTLGHAASLREQAREEGSALSFGNVLEMLEHQASANPDSPAVGMADFPAKGGPSPDQSPSTLTFRELWDLSAYASMALSRQVKARSKTDGQNDGDVVVALLCPSNIEFALTWLGLLRLGYTALFLAPGLGRDAMGHLCRTLKVETFFVHPDLRNTVPDDDDFGPKVVQIPPDLKSTELVSLAPRLGDCHIPSTAYICHSSGTSSGLPKPIYQSQEESQLPPATYTVTPLYHGGTPDCLRAWSSGAMCWLFPQGSVPITGANIIKSVQAARRGGIEVDYFSSVPFVLQMLLDEHREAGIRLLKTFDLVGYGGAALPRASGDKLVEAGVRLLSRMGSAECGFLMSSHRDYDSDKAWDYLRPIDDDPTLLSFEPREQGLSELVVKEKWPFKTKTNCDDGKAYATADLFEPHESIPHAWRYHGRADAQIVLANGKKFDPAPLEADIMAAAASAGTGLRDILIFGTDMNQAGALLFPSSSSGADVIDRVWPVVRAMNMQSQSHARIAESMLIVVPADEADDPPLTKSSKGTVMRAKAEERYEQFIKSSSQSSSSDSTTAVADDELYETVMECFVGTLGRDVDTERDLYQQGVDSISCTQIRARLESRRLVEGPLPLNVIYNERTVNGLVDYLLKLRHGVDRSDQSDSEVLKDMQSLVKQYGRFSFPGSEAQQQARTKRGGGNVVVLTGATGFLGAHILHLLRRDASVSKIYCLVRDTGNQEANDRVFRTLVQYGRSGLTNSDETTNSVQCLACRLAEPELGLSRDDKKSMLDEATVFIHAAWAVNFNLGLHSFEDQMVSTRNLINAAEAAQAKLLFLSSTAAVGASSSTSIPESLSTDPSDASPLGYSRSKWVTEQICDAANKAKGSHPPFVSIIRVGQLCANEEGIWNASEAYPLLLSTARVTGCLPIIDDRIDWIPVEVAAQAVLDIVGHGSEGKETAVYHVVNPHDGPDWKMLLQQLVDGSDCDWLQMVSPSDWIKRLEDALREKYQQHPSQALVGLWKGRYCRGGNDESTRDEPRFDISVTQSASPTIKDMKPLDITRVDKIWRWVSWAIN